MKYLRLKYFISYLKLISWKLLYKNKLQLGSFFIGFETSVRLYISGKGKIIIGHHTYISRRTDIESYDGSIIIGMRTFINKDCIFVSRESIIIGKNCMFGEQVSIYDHDHVFDVTSIPFRDQGFKSKPVVIGNNVWVGCKVFIGKGVSIGDNTIVAAGSIVVKDIPANVIFYNGKIKPIREHESI